MCILVCLSSFRNPLKSVHIVCMQHAVVPYCCDMLCASVLLVYAWKVPDYKTPVMKCAARIARYFTKVPKKSVLLSS